MFEKREWFAMILAIVIMAIIIVFGKNEPNLATSLRAILLAIIIILFVSIAKKITASKIDASVELKTWEFQRYGLGTASHFKRPVPIGLILPLLVSLITMGIVKLPALLQFEAKALPTKAVKKYGQRRFSGIMEWDDALIVFYSLMPLLVIAVICKFFTPIFLSELAKYSWIYIAVNLIPISKLDGTKLFFGSIPLFVFTWILTIVTWPIIF